MSVQAAIYSKLSGDSGVSALVSDRIYPIVNDSDTVTFPYVTYSVLSSARQRHLAGRAGLVDARVQITAWSEDHDEVISVIEAVRDAMDHKSHWTEDTQTVRGSFAEGESERFDPSPFAETSGVYSIAQDWRFWYEES